MPVPSVAAAPLSGRYLIREVSRLGLAVAMAMNCELQISSREVWSANRMHSDTRRFPCLGSCVHGKREFCVSRRVRVPSVRSHLPEVKNI